jgi:hypothetical protein
VRGSKRSKAVPHFFECGGKDDGKNGTLAGMAKSLAPQKWRHVNIMVLSRAINKIVISTVIGLAISLDF